MTTVALRTRTRAVRYAIVGGVAAGVDFGLLLILVPFLPLLVANTIAFVTANALNFVMAHTWVFGQSTQGQGVAAKYGAVLVISVIGLALNDALVWLGVVALGAGIVPSKLAATVLVWGWNYWARVTLVYRRA